METPLPPVETPPPTPPQPGSSLFTRLTNVFVAPGELFEEIKTARASVANWFAPAIIASVVGVTAILVMFSQPNIMRQMQAQQEKAFEKQVQAGKMTQQQADQILERMQKFMGPVMKIGGSVVVVILSFAKLFWWGLMLWLIGKWFLKAHLPYMKAVEIAGLSSMIVVLGGIVALLLIVILGKMFASLSLGLLVKDFDVANKQHLMLGAVNIFKIWAMALLGLGLAQSTGKPFARAMPFVLAYWIAMSLLLIAIGMGQFAL